MGQQRQHPVCWASPPPWVRQWCQHPTDNTTCRTLQVRNIRLGPSEYSTWSFIIFNMGLCNIQHWPTKYSTLALKIFNMGPQSTQPGPSKYSTWAFQVAMFESQMVVNCTWSCRSGGRSGHNWKLSGVDISTWGVDISAQITARRPCSCPVRTLCYRTHQVRSR